MAIRQMSTFSVPAFLFITGYFIAFMARGENSNVTWAKVLPRVRALIFPFVLWTIIRFALLRQFPTSLEEVLDPYHFVPLLIQYYLFSPVFVPLAKEHWKAFLTAAAVLHLGVQSLNYLSGLGVTFAGQELLLGLTPRWLFIGQQPFWFPLGLVFGLHTELFKEKLNPMRGIFAVSTIVLLILAFVEFELVEVLNGEMRLNPQFGGYSRTFFILSFLLWFITNESAVPFIDKISYLGARSLGVYMANIPMIYVVAVLMYQFAPWLLGKQFLYQSILFSAGLFGPLILMELIRRSPARQGYRYLFG
jgi:surface polysaccharide O-acyltransferase-like enzyme